MNLRFFRKMALGLLAVTLISFTLGHWASTRLTWKMTRVAPEHQQQLLAYASKAQGYFRGQQLDYLKLLTAKIAREHGAWSALRDDSGTLHSYSAMPENLKDTFDFQRKIDAPIHSFFHDVVIGIPFEQGGAFVIELPAEMYPKSNVALMQSLLTVVIPSILVLLFCWLLYRQIMRPLEVLSQTTALFANGELGARTRSQLPSQRHDEITQLAGAFDAMAERIENLVNSQQQMLGDLSHELRTPLTRMELTLSQFRDGDLDLNLHSERLDTEVQRMKSLIEDALTLAWLNDKPTVDCSAEFNLSDLLDVICDDACFEYPEHVITRCYPACSLAGSSQRLLSHIVENVLRNALKYSPTGSEVRVSGERIERGYQLKISDQGPGVPDTHLEDIFKPFYRLDKARSRDQGGFGLGLALVRRQLSAIGGEVWAENAAQGGLMVTMNIPSQSLHQAKCKGCKCDLFSTGNPYTEVR